MSHEEDLIDYSDEEIQPSDAVPATAPVAANGQAKKGDLTATGAPAAKGSYVGIHSTRFDDFLLKPELLRAIQDCGFEHPSEGMPLFLSKHIPFPLCAPSISAVNIRK